MSETGAIWDKTDEPRPQKGQPRQNQEVYGLGRMNRAPQKGQPRQSQEWDA